LFLRPREGGGKKGEKERGGKEKKKLFIPRKKGEGCRKPLLGTFGYPHAAGKKEGRGTNTFPGQKVYWPCRGRGKKKKKRKRVQGSPFIELKKKRKEGMAFLLGLPINEFLQGKKTGLIFSFWQRKEKREGKKEGVRKAEFFSKARGESPPRTGKGKEKRNPLTSASRGRSKPLHGKRGGECCIQLRSLAFFLEGQKKKTKLSERGKNRSQKGLEMKKKKSSKGFYFFLREKKGGETAFAFRSGFVGGRGNCFPSSDQQLFGKKIGKKEEKESPWNLFAFTEKAGFSTFPWFPLRGPSKTPGCSEESLFCSGKKEKKN